MKTKTIPFDLETAKKIQAGEIEGKIKTRKGASVRIVEWDMKNRNDAPIIALVDYGDYEVAIVVDEYGKKDVGPTKSMLDLVLEVPDYEPQFKPFDKVLGKSNFGEWVPDIYARMNATGRYICLGGIYESVIPYAGNESLVGTTDKPKEE